MANIKSFGDLGDGGSDDGSDDGGDGMNDYYAGGEKSGQLIRGAPKGDDEDNVASLFEKAKRAGAVQGSADDLKQPQQQAGSFQGTARTLAGGSSQPAAASGPQQQGPLLYVITFYRNNIFTVNDGPPRSTLDPANRAFIEAIGKGECPEELEPEVPGTPITVNLVRNESDYAAPEKPKVAAFQGTGRTLASGPSGASTSAAAASSAASEGEWEGVKEGQPTTSLQLRLADGSRMVAAFNHTHRVSDIRRFIRAARPELTFGYSLMTGVPPTPIDENTDKTLEEAGLLNSVIIQRK